jgi:hypothetical protein
MDIHKSPVQTDSLCDMADLDSISTFNFLKNKDTFSDATDAIFTPFQGLEIG